VCPVSSPLNKGTASRGERTRVRIRDVANRLFLEQGFDATTVDAIVDAAGISKGTFYIYFKRKEDLLLEYGWRRLKHLQTLVSEMLVEPTFEVALRKIVTSVMRNKTWSREVARRTIGEIINNGAMLESTPHKLFQPVVEIGQARGQVRTDVSSDALSHFVWRNLLGSFYDWGESGNTQTVDECLDQALMLIFSAVNCQ
jgi:AcrR family transcriptional regulator